MLALHGVTKTYGRTPVLEQVEATFRPNAVHFLMGPNGAGKTTLIKCILGLHRYTGSVTWNDRPLDPGDRLVFPVFDDPPWHNGLTGRQNLRVLVPEADPDQQAYLTEHVLRSRVKGYSHGQRMRLALTAAFTCGAELIILDEPTNGLDREAMHQLVDDLDQRRSDTTFLITGHNLEFYDSVIDTLHVFDGRTIVEHELDTATKGGVDLARIYDENYPSGHQ